MSFFFQTHETHELLAEKSLIRVNKKEKEYSAIQVLFELIDLCFTFWNKIYLAPMSKKASK